MKDMAPLDFCCTNEACEEGIAFAARYVSMHDVYEALLNGEAGGASLDWLVWIISRLQQDASYEEYPLYPDPIYLMLQFVPGAPANEMLDATRAWLDRGQPEGEGSLLQQKLLDTHNRYHFRGFEASMQRTADEAVIHALTTMCQGAVDWYLGDTSYACTQAVYLLRIAGKQEPADRRRLTCWYDLAGEEMAKDTKGEALKPLLDEFRRYPNPFKKEIDHA